MSFDAAVIKEQGVTFAVAAVRRGVLSDAKQREQSIAYFSSFFGGLPVALMEQDSGGTPTWYGRADITRFLQTVPVGAIPWKRYSA